MLYYSFPHRAAHLDFHNMPGASGVGRDFDAAEFGTTLKHASVEAVTVFAKDCNGHAYYPTAVGTPHPHLACDLTGGMIRGAREAGLTVTVYFNAGTDNIAGICHRDWTKLDAEGHAQPPGNYFDPAREGYFLRVMCPNSGYADYLLAMVREVLERYPEIDGIFLDCYTLNPCFGHECLEEMRQRGIDIHNPEAVGAFAHESTYRLAGKIQNLALSINPKLNVYHNGLAYRLQPNHIEIEVLPNGGWGYDYLPAALHYARTLGKPVLTMTGRFQNTWGDVNGVRGAAAIEYDFLYSLAHGGWCSLGDHLPRHGRLHPEVYRRCQSIYDRLRPLEAELAEQKPLADVLVLDPVLRFFPEALPTPQGDRWRLRPGLIGAVRLLSELKIQFDVGDDLTALSSYRVVILPDEVRLDAALQARLEHYLADGGKLISSGVSGLRPDADEFASEVYQGIGCAGLEQAFYNFIAPDGGEWPFANYQKGGIRLRRDGNAVECGTLYEPEYNRDSWDGEMLQYYVAPCDQPVAPAALANDRVLHIGIPAFTAYNLDAAEAMRAWLATLLRHWLPVPLLQTENLPSFAVASVMRRRQDYLIHLLNYVPQKRGNSEVIDEALDANDVRLQLRVGKDFPVGSVYTLPERNKLAFDREGELIRISLPRMRGYQLIAVTE